MGKTEKYYEEHSEEVREIMGQQANWMVRWGAGLLMLIVAVVVGVFFVIKHPVFVTVPFQVEAANVEPSDERIIGEAVVSETAYRQIKEGQEVQVPISGTPEAGTDRAVIGRVEDKLSGRRVRLRFAVEADQGSTVRAVLQQARTAKIKIGEERLISQFSGPFIPK